VACGSGGLLAQAITKINKNLIERPNFYKNLKTAIFKN